MGGESIRGPGPRARTAARGRLLRWYRRVRRDLPWRRTRDPWAIWVSEIMLQQTRVAAAIPYYERFLARFPDVHALAAAPLDDVLAAWSGLGYYRRARFLHAAARVVARDGMPRDEEGWRALPGVGRYTAAAVASIAFGRRCAVVDGNVERVLCRVHALESPRPAVLRGLADAWLSPRAPGDHNQAMMELGATVCTPRAPECGRCPLRDACAGRDDPGRYPRPRGRPALVTEERRLALDLRGGRVLLRRNAEEGRLAGLWELPAGAGGGDHVATVRHGILDRRLVLRLYRERAAGRGGRRFTAGEAAALPLATAARKCLVRAGFLEAGGRG